MQSGGLGVQEDQRHTYTLNGRHVAAGMGHRIPEASRAGGSRKPQRFDDADVGQQVEVFALHALMITVMPRDSKACHDDRCQGFAPVASSMPSCDIRMIRRQRRAARGR